MTRGDIYMLDFGIPFGSEPGMRRPVVIIQSDKENLNNLNTKVVVPLTSNTINSNFKGNVFISKKESGLSKDSVALVHQMVIISFLIYIKVRLMVGIHIILLGLIGGKSQEEMMLGKKK